MNLQCLSEVIGRLCLTENGKHSHPLHSGPENRCIDLQDVLEALLSVGRPATELAEQVRIATMATMKYYGPGGQAKAIEDGFVPITPEFRGHGIHWSNPGVVEQEFSIEKPNGLNYDRDGNLLAVYYRKEPRRLSATSDNPFAQFQVDPSDDHPPQPSFVSVTPEDWHTHDNVWLSGLGTLNADDLQFDQNLSLEEVAARWERVDGKMYPQSDQWFAAKTWMIHGWFHLPNPNGLFAGLHPDVSSNAPGEIGGHGGGQGGSGHREH